MKMSKYFLALLATATLWSCNVIDLGGSGDGNDEELENLTMEYTMRQARSAKRGISGPMQLESDITLLAPGVCWQYNWGASVPMARIMHENNMAFYPMAWNNHFGAGEMRAYKEAYPEDAQFILAYNEPNLTDQANMTPEVAASYWPELKQFAQQTGYKLISPAVNYGTLAGYHDPIKWLDEFFSQPGVSLDDVDGIAIHCYMPSGESLKSFVRLFDKYNKPIYMTEFCHAGSGITNDVAQQQRYMADVLNFMECDDKVGGYSWFMVRGSGSWKAISLLNTNAKEPALTELGAEYVYFSTFDKNCYYPTSEAFPAAHYRSNNAEALAESKEWQNTPKIKSSSDVTGPVVLCDFFATFMWVEYGIEVEEDGDYELLARYANLVDGTFDFEIDGQKVATKTFTATGSEDAWKTDKTDKITLTKGRHIMRVSLVGGRANFNWFCLRKAK